MLLCKGSEPSMTLPTDDPYGQPARPGPSPNLNLEIGHFHVLAVDILRDDLENDLCLMLRDLLL